MGENKTVSRPVADAAAHAPMRKDPKRVIR